MLEKLSLFDLALNIDLPAINQATFQILSYIPRFPLFSFNNICLLISFLKRKSDFVLQSIKIINPVKTCFIGPKAINNLLIAKHYLEYSIFR